MRSAHRSLIVHVMSESEHRPPSRQAPRPAPETGHGTTPSTAPGTPADHARIGLPDNVASSGTLERLVDSARDYAAQSTADNTGIAYAKDWAHFASWCRRRGVDQNVADPRTVGLYITECAAPRDGSSPLCVSTIERRLSGLSWTFRQQGLTLDRQDRHIATVLAGIRRKHGRPPQQKEAVLAEDILEMVSLLSFGLRDLRDRAILLAGFAGGLRRSEIVGLDVNRDDTQDGSGWIKFETDGALIVLSSKTGWREVEIGHGSSGHTCPMHALQIWLHHARIDVGPVFRAVTRDNRNATADRLSDKHVARLVKRLVLEAGIRPDLPDAERVKLFSGHSLRAGLASSAKVEERHVQKQLGHASVQMTRRYQRRRDRFRVNLTKAAGL